MSVEDADSTPKPIYNRGIYFDGNDELVVHSLMLNNIWSAEIWIRPDTTETTTGHLLTINSTYIELILDGHSIPEMLYVGNELSSNITLQSEWTYILTIINLQFASIRINADTENVKYILNQMFVDDLDYPHIIGSDY